MGRAVRRALLAAGFALAASPVLGASCEDIEFPETASVAGSPLTLNGLGIRKATIFNVHVYVAGLYLPRKSDNGGAVLGSGGPWRLELRFLRDVDAEDMHAAFQEGFQKVGADREALRPRIEQLNGLIEDIEEGQALAFANDPRNGVIVERDNTAIGLVLGSDFAAALLAIWIGPLPPNDELKEGLLGGACE